MTLATMDREDVKAMLRKRFGSVFAFEDARDLPRKSVSDFLRGRPNQRVSDEITKLLDLPDPSDLSDVSSAIAPAHRQNAGAS